jgi:aryl-alcohol dehydrogenase-like predicted oxidoreductase
LQECEESLLRLRTDYIDLYQIHWPLSPLDEAAQALAELKGQGKIRFVGLCNTNVEQIIEWKNLTGFHPDFVQERYSLIQRKIDAGLKPYTLKHAIPILAYSPLAQANKYAAGNWKRKNAPQWALNILLKFHNFRRT